MGTIISVARYPNQLWGLTCDLLKKHKDKCGYAKPVSHSVSRNFRFLFSSYKCDNEAEKLANLIVLTVQTASQTCIIAEVKF